MTESGDPDHQPNAGSTQNRIDGSAHGHSFQVGSVYGNIHYEGLPQRAIRRRLRWWAIAAVTLVVVGTGTGFALWRAGQSADSPARALVGSDSASGGASLPLSPDGSTSSSSPTTNPNVQLQSGYLNGCSWRYLTQPAPASDMTSDQVSGLPIHTASSAAVTITAQSPGTEDIVLLGMSVTIQRRYPVPSSGSLVKTGSCGSGMGYRVFDVDLDRSPVTVTPVAGTEPGTDAKVPPVSFPYKVNNTDPEILLLNFSDKNCNCEFSITIDWVDNGHRGQTVIDDHGAAFHFIPDVKLSRYYVTLDENNAPTVMPWACGSNGC